MKIIIALTLLATTLLFGCSSTDDKKTQDSQVRITQNKESGTNVSEKEFEELAKNSQFTTEQLRSAANSLGYKCTLYKVTGSRIKKKLCTTKQQREVREEAARELLRRNRQPHISDRSID
jgi:uncharacterized protein YcfL